MGRLRPDEDRSHRRLFAGLSLALVVVTAWAVFDEVVTRRPWTVHQESWLAATEQGGGPRVLQLVVPGLDAVDRCTTCHAGSTSPDPLPSAPAVLAPHPDFDTLLGNHPPERFGCVVCHRGQGAALTEQTAHASERGYWPDPMLPGSYAQASCLGCHPDDEDLPGAPLLSRGRALFVQLGCDDCHLAGIDGEGSQSRHKRGPSLRRVASKLRPGALLTQIRAPMERRQGYRMPRFWPGADTDPAMAARRDSESLALAAFLLASSEGWSEAETPSAPGDVAAGEVLFDTVGCRGCHVLGIEGRDDVVVDAAPAATGDDAWGDFGGGGDAWGDFGDETEAEPTPAPAVPALSHGPALGGIAARLRPGFLLPWLLDPADYDPATPMPSLRLDATEAADLAAWLRTLGSSEAPETPPELAGTLDPDLVDRGRALVAEYGCFGCHHIPGFEDEGRSGADLTEYGRKTRQQMHFGSVALPEDASAWDLYTRTKLLDPRAFESPDIPQIMPGYVWEDGEVDALAVYLRGLRGDAPPAAYVYASTEPAPVAAGRQLAADRNCVGCHTLDGVDGGIRRHYSSEAHKPPILDGEGERARPDWLYGFLMEPSPLRPWLDVRMPSFGFQPAEAEALVAWLGARAGASTPFRPATSRPLSPERAALGAAMFTDLKCVTCHQLASGAGVDSADLAPDLGLARQRLDRAWVRRFLQDPGALLPGTRMPQFFPDGQSPFPELLGGDSAAQIDLLIDHLMNLGLQSSSPALAPDPQEQGAADGQ